MKVCTIDGCDRKRAARGWCDLHYRYWKRYGDAHATPTHPGKWQRDQQFCSVEGCGQKHYGKGYCRTHYAFWKRNGTLERRPPRVCQVVDCGKPNFGHDYCRLHWERWKKHGDPLLGAMGKPVERVCVACDETFRPCNTSRLSSRRLCYSCAPGPGDTAFCLVCGTAIVLVNGRHFTCSRACKTKALAQSKLGYANCSVCDRLITLHDKRLSRYTERGTIQCVGDCQKEHRRSLSREYQRANYEQLGKPAARRNTAKRRARLSGALVVDAVDISVLLDRDGNVCHLCEGSINPDLSWPDPMSPSIDHVVPVSLGGEHSYGNTAPSHLLCNMSKGNRVAAD